MNTLKRAVLKIVSVQIVVSFCLLDVVPISEARAGILPESKRAATNLPSRTAAALDADVSAAARFVAERNELTDIQARVFQDGMVLVDDRLELEWRERHHRNEHHRPVKLEISVDPNNPDRKLNITVGENGQVKFIWAGYIYEGYFDKSAKQIIVTGKNLPANWPAENWIFQLKRHGKKWVVDTLQKNFTYDNTSQQPIQSRQELYSYDSKGLVKELKVMSHFLYGEVTTTTTLFSYTHIGDKCFVKSMIIKSSSSDGSEWFHKIYNSYNARGQMTGVLQVWTHATHGIRLNYARYWISDNPYVVFVELDGITSTQWMDQIHSFKDYDVVDRLAKRKTEMYYKNPSTQDGLLYSVEYVKNANNHFIAQTVTMTDSQKTFIVVGVPDVLSGENNDILIRQAQTVNGYQVYWGHLYGQRGYGLFFTKIQGNYCVVLADYPEENKVTLDGKQYKILIDSEGNVRLEAILISPEMQAYVDRLQGEIGSDYKVSVKPVEGNDSRYEISVVAVDQSNSRKIKSISYQVATDSWWHNYPEPIKGSIKCVWSGDPKIDNPMAAMLYDALWAYNNYLRYENADYYGLIHICLWIPTDPMPLMTQLTILDAKDGSVYFRVNNQNWFAVKDETQQIRLKKDLPDHVLAYRQKLVEEFGSNFEITVTRWFQDREGGNPDVRFRRGVRYDVTIKAKDPNPAYLKKLMFTIETKKLSYGEISELPDSFLAIYAGRNGGPDIHVNGRLLYQGLKLIDPANAIADMAKIRITRERQNMIRFELDGTEWSVFRDRHGRTRVHRVSHRVYLY